MVGFHTVFVTPDTTKKNTMKRIVIPLFILLFTNLSSGAELFLRTPSISPDGKKIAFSYEGDIWVVPDTGGRATRLTARGYNFNPDWSPDGRYIAFNSDRNHNFDVHLLSLDDGSLTQLTYWTGDDILLGWNEQKIVFRSRRELTHRGTIPYIVELSGGTPKPLLEFIVSDIDISKNGTIAFTRGTYSWWRKGYRGSASSNIWISEGDSLYLLFGEDYNDGHPMWSGKDTLYFLSDRDGTSNIYRYSMSTGNIGQLTSFKNDGVRNPAIGGMGRKIVFEKGFGVYILDTHTLRVRELDVEVIDEGQEDVWITQSKDITEFAISSGVVSFVIRGDIYIGDTEGGSARRVTICGGRKIDIELSEEGDLLYFASNSDGNYDISKIESGDEHIPNLALSLKLEEERVISTPLDEHSPKLSPCGKLLAFIRGRGNLVIYDLNTRRERLLVEEWAVPEYAWSPDSRWIAYRGRRDYVDNIYVVNVDNGKPFNISKHPMHDIFPIWSNNGRFLAFSGKREGDYDVWWVYLREEDDRKTEADWRREKALKDEDTIISVTIDFDDIDERIRRGTDLPGDAILFAICPDNERFIFRSDHTGESDLYILKKENGELTPLTRGGMKPTQIIVEDNNIYYLSLGRIRKIGIDGKGSEGINFDIRERICIRSERGQIFDEVWWTLKNEFYDENFHGVDWENMYHKYREQAVKMRHPYEFRNVIRLMLGELNSSHLSIFKPRETLPIPTGILGVVWDPDYEGDGLRVARVIKNSPGWREESRLHNGDIILSIDGIDIGDDNIYKMLQGKVDKLIRLRVRDKRERDVWIRPTDRAHLNKLLYEEWVDSRRSLIEELSGGVLGYIHIPHMGWASIDKFQQEIYRRGLGKDGLVIDVRDNSGGWIADHLLAMLDTRVHSYTVRRDDEPGYPISERLPYYVWTKPSIVLINENTVSNAEIFAHAYKTLEIGNLVGNRTVGSVISTRTKMLKDGMRFTVPGRGWFRITDGMNLEGSGAIPDYLVHNLPGQLSDEQLTRAVEILMEDLE